MNRFVKNTKKVLRVINPRNNPNCLFELYFSPAFTNFRAQRKTIIWLYMIYKLKSAALSHMMISEVNWTQFIVITQVAMSQEN